jgi:hypothetical protein
LSRVATASRKCFPQTRQAALKRLTPDREWRPKGFPWRAGVERRRPHDVSYVIREAIGRTRTEFRRGSVRVEPPVFFHH